MVKILNPQNILSRYVSISVHSIPSPIYLCEVEILSPVAEQIALAQCGAEEEADMVGIKVINNMCVFIDKERNKVTFKEAENICKKKGMRLLNKETGKDAAVYEFVKY